MNKCELCDESFETYEGLLRHTRKKHGDFK
jgi:hypothetical protein